MYIHFERTGFTNKLIINLVVVMSDGFILFLETYTILFNDTVRTINLFVQTQTFIQSRNIPED